MPDFDPSKSIVRGSLLERAVLIHLSILIVGLSWSFGGQIPWARQALLIWGVVGVFLFVLAATSRPEEGRSRWRPLLELWPLVLYDIAVGASCFNPGFKPVTIDGQSYFQVTSPPYSWLPSSALPSVTLRELLQFNVIVLSCYSIRLVLHSRRSVRVLLAVIAGNAMVLAIFGTFQKLAGAKGLWFGLVETPQTYFFSTFVYHNHWGAFTLLNTAACLGLLAHVLRRRGDRAPIHQATPAAMVAVLFIAASVPLSASRSSSALMVLLLLAALGHLLLGVIRKRRAHRESVIPPVVAIVLVAALAFGGMAYLARKVIAQRAELTAAQLAHLRKPDALNARLVLYSDTWRMAQEKPWFGWGLETYGQVFRIFNSQRAVERRFGQPYYREAHSDWLQSLAETGFVGTSLLVLLGLVPVAMAPWRKLGSALPHYLLGGCLLILAYAWLEFPFANPSVMVAFWCSLYAAVTYARLDAAVREPAHSS